MNGVAKGDGAHSRDAPRAMGTRQLAVQLWTLRRETAQDFPGTLRQVAETGIAGVEFAGYGTHTPAELRRVLDDLNLEAAGSHVGLAQLETRLDAVMEDTHTLGARHLACPSIPEDRRRGADDYRRVGELLSQIGARCKANGIQLSYHNHDFEFQQFDGRYALEILAEAADPEALMLQLDLGWVAHAGLDPVGYLRQFTGRVPTLHFKDMSADPQGMDTPLGDGRLPIPELIAAAREAGTEWFIIEQDHPQGSPIEAVRRSAAYMRAQGVI